MSENPAYELFEELGAGEHTVVYRGYDVDLGRDIAIKQLDERSRGDDRRAEQFLKEAGFLAQFEHENILRIYSVDRERGWIVMELMQGTLASQIAKSPMPADTVRSVMRQILSALEFLHDKNKVHGAVRPSNILINDRGIAKLSDFEATDSSAELRAPTGSKKHLAPELIRPEFGDFGPTVDLYCLGFTALELLTGPRFESLFPGTGKGAIDADVAWLRWHSSDEPLESVSKLCPHVPTDLANVIDRLLSKNASDRPQSAAETLDMLSEQAFIPVVVPEGNATGASASPQGVAGPATPKPQQPAMVPVGGGAAARSGNPKSSRTSSAAVADDRSAKDKLNDFLGKPYVLWPLCAAMLIGAVFIGLRLRADKSTGGGDETPIVASVDVQFQIAPDADGAKLLIDGVERTLVDQSLELNAGEYEVRVTKPGFADYSQSLTVADEDLALKIAMQELPATEPSVAKVRMLIQPNADDAVISVDGQIRSLGSDDSLVLMPGVHTVTVEKYGFETFSSKLAFNEGEHDLSVSLKAIPETVELARLRFSVVPGGAGTQILIDGVAAASEPSGDYVVEPGVHRFDVSKQGYTTYSQTVMVEPGESEYTIELVKEPELTPDVVKVQLTISPPPEQWQAGSAGEDAVQPEPKLSERAMFVEVEAVKDADFQVVAERPGYRPIKRSIKWESLVAARFRLNLSLDQIDDLKNQDTTDDTSEGDVADVTPEFVDPFATMLINAENDAGLREEKVRALAEEFTGEAELVIDSGGFLEMISDVSFSPDGRLIAATGAKEVRIWNVSTGELVATLRGDRSRTPYGNVYAAEFSPDGKTLLVGINDYRQHGSIREYSTDDFSEIKRLVPGHTAPCRKLAFNGSGQRRISVDSDGNLLVSDTSSDKVITTIQASNADSPIFDVACFPSASEDIVFAMDFNGPRVFSPEGRVLGPQDPMPDRMLGWFMDVLGRKVQYPFGATTDPRVLDFELDRGRWAAAGVSKVEGRNRFWAAIFPARGSQESTSALPASQVYAGHRWSITAVELGPRGELAASGDRFGEVHVWNQKTGERIHLFKGQGRPIYEVAFDANSNRIAFGTRPFTPDVWARNNYGAVTQILDLRQRAILPIKAADNVALINERPQLGNLSVDVSRDAEEAAYRVNLKQNGQTISNYRISSARNPTVYTLVGAPRLGVERPVVFGDNDGLLALWDSSSDQLRRAFVGHDALVSGVSFSKNGKLMVSSSSDRTIRIWSLENYRPTGIFDFKYENTSVIKVVPGSSSEQAGVRVGDEIISMDGLTVTEIYNQMLQKKFAYRPGDVVEMKMKRDGREYSYKMTMATGYDFEEPTLNFFVGDDGQWIIWSPLGYYDASPGADRLIGWHVNRGPDKSARFYEVQQFREQLYRPDVIDMILDGNDVQTALKLANEARPTEDVEHDFRRPEEIAEYHPPEVRLLHDGELETTEQQFAFAAEVSSANGLAVRDATLLHNGNVVQVFRPEDLSGERLAVTAEVQLKPGRNRLEVVASNGKATSSATGITVTLKRTPTRTPKPDVGDVYVLAVGVSEYLNREGGLLNIASADADARQFVSQLKRHANGRLYGDVNERLLDGKSATRTNVLDGFQWLVDNVKTGDTVMIFFSGHAFVDTQENFYLATRDADISRARATAVSWRQLIDMLHEDLPACRRLLFLDARPTEGGLKPGMRNPLLDLAAPELGMTFFASNTLQQAIAPEMGSRQGTFVRAITTTLGDRRSDLVPNPRDQLLNSLELGTGIRKRVQEASAGRQMPTYFATAARRADNLFELFSDATVDQAQ